MVAVGVVSVRPRMEELVRPSGCRRSRKAGVLPSPALGAPVPPEEGAEPRAGARALVETAPTEVVGIGSGEPKGRVLPSHEKPVQGR